MSLADEPPGGSRGVGSLRAAQEAVTLARRTHELTAHRGARTHARLRGQICDAAVSVYANIVEGNARGARRDTLRFISIAWASLREFEAHLEVASATALLSADGVTELRRRARWVGRLLWGLRRHYREH